MATSHFTQFGKTPEPVEAQESAKGAVALSPVRRSSGVYHQKPGRILDTPFNADYLKRLSCEHAETTHHFYAYFTKLLLISLTFRLRSTSLAEDAAQETLLRVLLAVRRGEIQFPDRLAGFVRSVSENVAKEMGRKSARFQQIPENNPEPVAKVANAELYCISEEQKQALLRALHKLNDKDRELLVKVYIRELDKDMICNDLKIDRSALRVRIFRALARLRTVISETDPKTPMVKKAAVG